MVGSTQLANNLFTFTGLANGEYIIRAALNPTNPDFENYLPTYNYSEEDWDAAYAINLYGMVWSQDPLNMVLLSVNLNPGSGLIGGGIVIEDTVRSIALENVMVYVKNQQGVITKYDMTDANGVFQLTNLAFGTYTISADIPGYICPSQTITLNAQNPAFSEVELHLFPVTEFLTSINQTENNFSVGTPYPNPTEGAIAVNIITNKSQSLTFTVYNMLSQPVLSQSNAVGIGNQTIQLQTESLAQGIYILQIADKKTGAVVTKKIVKD
ncbi:MAG: T9SS type A sorting domain-containing protein [Sphingobacteriales bacterium JAD_PAG50586_3]|nr:MAG: T9SS type A sorting domain-containing protein [Sphingobacteriales bacterium JAD_PAG50586_3]